MPCHRSRRLTISAFSLVVCIALACDASEPPVPSDTATSVFFPPDIEVLVEDLSSPPADTLAEDTGAAPEDTATVLEDTLTDIDSSIALDATDTAVDTIADTAVDTTLTDTAADTSIADTLDTTLTDTAADTSIADTLDTSIADTALDTIVADTTLDTTLADTTAPEAEVVAPAPEHPEIIYTLSAPRTLLFLNNPEQIITTDLGDAALGDKTLYRVTATGACRSFFEHVNRTNRTIGFGIQAYNPGPATVTVTVRAAGWVASILGGAPFADAFNGANAAAPVTLPAGASAWLFRKDESVTHNTFFSGVVDFDIAGGSLILNHIAYDSFAALDGSTTELGYVQRVEPDNTHEARMYKGVATASEATAALDLRLDDATTGAITLNTARYTLAAGYAPATESNAWTTHIGPAQNATAITSDMVGFTYGSWFFDPFAASDGEGRHPNLGNWGVVYRLNLRVHNASARTRTVTYRITASPGAGAGLARQASTSPWTAHRIEKGVALDLGALTVPPGATRDLNVAWVLGGPSGGGLKNELIAD